MDLQVEIVVEFRELQKLITSFTAYSFWLICEKYHYSFVDVSKKLLSFCFLHIF